jgi:hypothetical protein
MQMASSWHIVSLVGAFAVAGPTRSAAPAPGFIVFHFMPAISDATAHPACQAAKPSGRVRTRFQPYRRTDGTLLTITGHVALRFKKSTTERQIDSLIGATGVEAFASPAGRGCRRFVIRVVRPDDDPTAVANALQQSGLVDYAAPDLAAGRSEGVPSDSFFLDQGALSSSLAKNSIVADSMPTTYGAGQILSTYTGPVLRVTRTELSAALAAATSSMSALDLVKTHGLTALRLQVPQRSPVATVRIMIYSLTGTPVRQLVSDALDAGQYIVGWDGTDDRGRRVQPGVYVAVMTAGEFHETHRLVVR